MDNFLNLNGQQSSTFQFSYIFTSFHLSLHFPSIFFQSFVLFAIILLSRKYFLSLFPFKTSLNFKVASELILKGKVTFTLLFYFCNFDHHGSQYLATTAVIDHYCTLRFNKISASIFWFSGHVSLLHIAYIVIH